MLALLQSQLSDPRDNRGKKHDLGFVILSFFLAILETTGHLNRQKIHRQMQRQCIRYQNFMDFNAAGCISYPQLGRILKTLNYNGLNRIFEQYFGRILKEETQEWFALDGKELRGSIDKATGAKRGENIIMKVGHFSKCSAIVGYYQGHKEGEKSTVFNYLENKVKKEEKYTLDALHLSAKTLQKIHQKGAYYLVQLKGNQAHLLADAKHTTLTLSPDFKIITYDKGHGREEQRSYEGYLFPEIILDKRWQDSGLQTVIKVERLVRTSKTNKESKEVSFYVSNIALSDIEFDEFCIAIRFHWTVETQNHQLDRQLGQDYIQSFDTNTQRVMAVFCNHALNWLKKVDKGNNLSKLREDILDDKDLLYKLFNSE